MPDIIIEERPSPNHGPRVGNAPVDVLLLHYTGMNSAEGSLAWLTDPRSQVSSHYFIFEDGRTLQLVPEAERAWHAGASTWMGETDINSRSIGIEIANPGHRFGYRDFPEMQVTAVISLCQSILSRHVIPPPRILAHSDVAPLRKEDPGERFPWDRLHVAGIGFWLPPEPFAPGPALRQGDRGRAVAELKDRFRAYGYGLAMTDEFDDEMAAVVRAFQRHFRPNLVDGVADRSTVLTLDKLLTGLNLSA